MGMTDETTVFPRSSRSDKFCRVLVAALPPGGRSVDDRPDLRTSDWRLRYLPRAAPAILGRSPYTGYP